MAPLTVEIWSDVVCPWCYIGKRRFEAALADFPHEVETVWRSFELDPGAPATREHTATAHLAAKYGMSLEQAQASHAQMTELAAAEGLEYHFETARGGNSFDAHRLIHLAAAHGLQAEAQERVMRAYFTEGVAIGDREQLVALAADLGLDEVLVYRFDAATGGLTPNQPPAAHVAPGAGPRHVAFHPDGRHAYVINEMQSTITAFGYDPRTGALAELQTLSTVPAGYKKIENPMVRAAR